MAKAYTIAWMAERFLAEHGHGLRYVKIERLPGIILGMRWQCVQGMTWTVDYDRLRQMMIRTVLRVNHDAKVLQPPESAKAYARISRFCRDDTRDRALSVAAKLIANPEILVPFEMTSAGREQRA